MQAFSRRFRGLLPISANTKYCCISLLSVTSHLHRRPTCHLPHEISICRGITAPQKNSFLSQSVLSLVSFSPTMSKTPELPLAPPFELLTSNKLLSSLASVCTFLIKAIVFAAMLQIKFLLPLF